MQKINPLVSICIPTYKQLDHLALTLKSIEEQTFKNFEVVITDDTQDDSVLLLIRSLKLKYKINYYKNSHQLGSPSNWNEAIKKSCGTYIKIMHHDDKFNRPDSLEIFVNKMEQNKNISIAFSASCGSNFTSKLHVINRPSVSNVNSFILAPFLLTSSNIIGAPSAVMFRRDIDLLFDDKIKWLVDVDFYIQCIKKFGDLLYINQVLIETAIGETHQVTATFIDNPTMLAKEHLYLFTKYPYEAKKHMDCVEGFWFAFFSKYGGDFNMDSGLISYDEMKLFNDFKSLYNNSFFKRCIYMSIGKVRKQLKKLR